jgi:Tfp pilus assembly protein PilO
MNKKKSGVVAILIGALLIILGFWLLGQDNKETTDEQPTDEQPNEEKTPRKVKEKPVYEEAIIVSTDEQPNEE